MSPKSMGEIHIKGSHPPFTITMDKEKAKVGRETHSHEWKKWLMLRKYEHTSFPDKIPQVSISLRVFEEARFWNRPAISAGRITGLIPPSNPKGWCNITHKEHNALIMITSNKIMM